MVADGCTGLILPGGLMGDIIVIFIFYADHPAIVINQAEKAMPGDKAAKKRVSTLPASGRHPLDSGGSRASVHRNGFYCSQNI